MLYGAIKTEYVPGEFTEMTYSEIIAQADEIKSRLAYLERVGQEGFIDSMKPILRGLGNLFFHLLNTSKTNLFKFYKNVKRSEIRYFNEANKFSMDGILNAPFVAMSQFMVPIPSGMVGRYMEVIPRVDDCLRIIDMRPRAKCARDWIKALQRDVTSNRDIQDVGWTNFEKELHLITQAKGLMDKQFTAPNRPTKKLGEVFLNSQELTDANQQLLGMEGYLHQVPIAMECLEDINKAVDSIINYLEHHEGTKLTRTQLDAMANTVRLLAQFFDYFGDTLLVQNKVEHNYCQVLQELKGKIKTIGR